MLLGPLPQAGPAARRGLLGRTRSLRAARTLVVMPDSDERKSPMDGNNLSSSGPFANLLDSWSGWFVVRPVWPHTTRSVPVLARSWRAGKQTSSSRSQLASRRACLVARMACGSVTVIVAAASINVNSKR